MKLVVGENIDQFRIEAVLGEGGMGVVYQAYDLNLARKVALKVMHPHLARNSQFRDRFLQEAQAAARLDHPSIVRVHNFASRPDFLYLVMEFVSGPNLARYFVHQHQQQQPLDLTELLPLMAQVAEALDYAHTQGVVHRDVKPDNLLLKTLPRPEREGEPPLRVVVTDFGLAKLLEGGLQTQSGTFMGTLAYMSPEQCLGKALDGRSDLYSLGVVLYQIVTNRLPFQVNSPSEAIQKHVYEAPPPPRQARADLPQVIEQLILKAMAKEADARFESGNELARALRAGVADLQKANTTFLQLPTPLPAVGSKVTQLQPQEQFTLSGQIAFAQAAADQAKPTPVDQLWLGRKGEQPQPMALHKTSYTMGRHPENDLVLEGQTVSQRHARLERTASGWQVVDSNSANGTYLQNMKLLPGMPQIWQAEAQLRIGPYFLQWQAANKQVTVSEGLLSKAQPLTGLEGSAALIGKGASTVALAIAPNYLELDPGQQGNLQVTALNEGMQVEHFDLRLVGPLAEWARFSEEQLQLMPGARAFIHLTIQPPRTSKALAGSYSFLVEAASAATHVVAAQAQGELKVKAFAEFAADMRPQRLPHGRVSQISVDNRGNSPATFQLSGRDPAEVVRFEGIEQALVIGPNEQGQAPVCIGMRRQPWLGRSQTFPFTIQVSNDDGQQQTMAGQLDVSPLIPGWLLSALGAVLLFLCVAAAGTAAWVNFGGLAAGGSPELPGETVIAVAEAGEPTITPALVAQSEAAAPAPDTPTATPTHTPTRTPTATPTHTATPNLPPANAQLSDTWIRPRDSMVMVYVPAPAAPFTLRSDLAAPTESYWIDKYEVTNAQYQLCVAAGVCEPSDRANDTNFNGANQPVVGVTWSNAAAYAAWVGGALPTEEAWEYAAVGEAGTEYPWGDEFDGTRLNFCDVNCPSLEMRDSAWDDGYRYTAPVGSYPDGESWVGAADMAGNVYEWTDSWSDATQTRRVLRGGSWSNYQFLARAPARLGYDPGDRDLSIGFRVVVRRPPSHPDL